MELDIRAIKITIVLTILFLIIQEIFGMHAAYLVQMTFLLIVAIKSNS